MTVEKNGQLAWTFEEIDFEGTLIEIGQEINHLIDYRATKEYGSWFFDKATSRIDMLVKISAYIERLKWGVSFRA